MSQAAVTVDNVSKRFRLYHERNQSIKVALMRRRRAVMEEFWALQDVSLEVPVGTTFGLIGENGSGKSTLLKCMTKILRPDRGTIAVHGKVSALLELGAGFHPELSGRDNVYLNGAILGLNRKQLDRKFDEIVDFAGLEQFIDQPVKNYSSGMYVRLGFSVAINVDPEVLLIDEVLAVGDEAFQRKCREKFAELKEENRTIVLVTHNTEAVHHLCEEAAWIEHGRVKMVDTSAKVVDEYLGNVQADREVDADSGEVRWGSGEGRIEHVEFLDLSGAPVTGLRTGDALTIRFHYDFKEPIERPVFAIAIHTVDGAHVTGPNNRDGGCVPERLSGRGHVDLCVERLLLLPGTYEVAVALWDYHLSHQYDVRYHLFRFDVEAGDPRENYGVTSLGGRWQIDGVTSGGGP